MPEPGDWYLFFTREGKLTGTRLAGVSPDNKVFTGWFFGPFVEEPDASFLQGLRPEDAVCAARFYGLWGVQGDWQRVVGGSGESSPEWTLDDFGAGPETGPWIRLRFDAQDPSRTLREESSEIDWETFDRLPSGGTLYSGKSLEYSLDYVFCDPRRFRRLALVDAERERRALVARRERKAKSGA